MRIERNNNTSEITFYGSKEQYEYFKQLIENWINENK